ncbi:Tryptophan--tRNA ligase [Gossypium arboreum]|uniref:Tryptophan--tRNA ligase n=1 Tax=Gossypium arboreum TaxID=29729 RepID=A0A0B0PP03_GOSAR|nr:Tryptophan--tRNA ligase [Gossypium arboreum]
MNYDREILVNYIILCYIPCMLIYGKVSLFLSYELTKLYSLHYFIYMFYSLTMLARIGDCRRSHHTIKLLFWVSMILIILRIWHV